jgi:hypothetical protein
LNNSVRVERDSESYGMIHLRFREASAGLDYDFMGSNGSTDHAFRSSDHNPLPVLIDNAKVNVLVGLVFWFQGSISLGIC